MFTSRSGFNTARGSYRISLTTQEGPILTKKTRLITRSFANAQLKGYCLAKIVGHSVEIND